MPQKATSSSYLFLSAVRDVADHDEKVGVDAVQQRRGHGYLDASRLGIVEKKKRNAIT